MQIQYPFVHSYFATAAGVQTLQYVQVWVGESASTHM